MMEIAICWGELFCQTVSLDTQIGWGIRTDLQNFSKILMCTPLLLNVLAKRASTAALSLALWRAQEGGRVMAAMIDEFVIVRWNSWSLPSRLLNYWWMTRRSYVNLLINKIDWISIASAILLQFLKLKHYAILRWYWLPHHKFNSWIWSANKNFIFIEFWQEHTGSFIFQVASNLRWSFCQWMVLFTLLFHL